MCGRCRGTPTHWRLGALVAQLLAEHLPYANAASSGGGFLWRKRHACSAMEKYGLNAKAIEVQVEDVMRAAPAAV